MRVLFTTSKHLISQIIRYYTNFDSSHVAMEVNDYVYESTTPNVTKTEYKKFLKTNRIVHNINLDEVYPYLTEIDNYTVEKLAEKFLNKRYGYLTLLGIMLNDALNITWFADGHKSFICSEFVTVLLNSVIPDELPIRKIPDFVTPKDLYKILNKHHKKFQRRKKL